MLAVRTKLSTEVSAKLDSLIKANAVDAIAVLPNPHDDSTLVIDRDLDLQAAGKKSWREALDSISVVLADVKQPCFVCLATPHGSLGQSATAGLTSGAQLNGAKETAVFGDSTNKKGGFLSRLRGKKRNNNNNNNNNNNSNNSSSNECARNEELPELNPDTERALSGSDLLLLQFVPLECDARARMILSSSKRTLVKACVQKTGSSRETPRVELFFASQASETAADEWLQQRRGSDDEELLSVYEKLQRQAKQEDVYRGASSGEIASLRRNQALIAAALRGEPMNESEQARIQEKLFATQSQSVEELVSQVQQKLRLVRIVLPGDLGTLSFRAGDCETLLALKSTVAKKCVTRGVLSEEVAQPEFLYLKSAKKKGGKTYKDNTLRVVEMAADVFLWTQTREIPPAIELRLKFTRQMRKRFKKHKRNVLEKRRLVGYSSRGYSKGAFTQAQLEAIQRGDESNEAAPSVPTHSRVRGKSVLPDLVDFPEQLDESIDENDVAPPEDAPPEFDSDWLSSDDLLDEDESALVSEDSDYESAPEQPSDSDIEKDYDAAPVGQSVPQSVAVPVDSESEIEDLPPPPLGDDSSDEEFVAPPEDP